MKKRYCIGLLILALCFLSASAAFAIDKNKAAAIEEKYTDNLKNFDPSVSVRIKGSEVEVVLQPDKTARVPKSLSDEKRVMTWKDVAEFESKMMVSIVDPYARWFIENLWRDRINRVLKELEPKIKEKYPDTYRDVSISVKSVADALGMDPAIGFFTGEAFVKIPKEYGGRVPNVDPLLIEQAEGYIDVADSLPLYASRAS